ncbi:aspartyl-phosphate phosphatase Spo0E family protein [Ammoniphilus sp. YIM 78166]|uniref:aspartyl-phosphate phosphatase Spo0E family protein n=1 Tax=Ammoniphilus sp. YIM 78166 TaxID=1644106 RepID=UPI00106F44D5|nr:aspartyl-phosphate phosphatase Spo0E family protein [Ammoniphilus sp. YIM 78166]
MLVPLTDLLQEIEEKRELMHKVGLEFGLTSDEVLVISQEIDELVNRYFASQ